MPKYFKSLSFSQLFFKDRLFSTRSQCLCSKHISDSSKSSQSQIDLFFLVFFPFILATRLNRTTMISPLSWQLMMALWQHYCLEEELSCKVDFSKCQGAALQSSPRAPGHLEQNQEGFPLITHLRCPVAKCSVQYMILLSLAPCVLASLVLFWV